MKRPGFSLVRIAVLAAVAFIAGTVDAHPQTGTFVSPGGLFGPDTRPAPQRLDFSFSVSQGSDADRYVDANGNTQVDSPLGRYSTMLRGTGRYRLRTRNVEFGVSSEVTGRQYNALGGITLDGHSEAVGLSAKLGARSTLYANQTVTYTPAYLYGLFPSAPVTTPAQAVPVASDYGVAGGESYSYATTLAVTRSLSPRNRVMAAGDFQYTEFSQTRTAATDLHWGGARLEFSRNVTRRTAIELGYQYRSGRFRYNLSAVPARPYLASSTQGLDVTVKHSTLFSATRHLDLALRVGAVAVGVHDISLPQSEGLPPVRMSGEAGLTWHFDRFWRVRALYNRDIEYVPGFSAPLFTNGISSELGGATARVDVAAIGSYSIGHSTVAFEPLAFNSYSVGARVQYRVVGTLAVYGQYLHYFYDLQERMQLVPGVPQRMERNAIRAGLAITARGFAR